MPGISPYRESGPATFEVSAAVKGGQLVMADGTTGKVKVATNVLVDTVRTLGVALQDAEPAGTDPAGTTAYGYPFVDVSRPDQYTSVAYAGMEARVTYTLAANMGDPLIVGTVAGTVSPAGVAPDARTIVGRCTEPLGVAAGEVGIMRIGN